MHSSSGGQEDRRAVEEDTASAAGFRVQGLGIIY
jgi:hypothetical protein